MLSKLACLALLACFGSVGSLFAVDAAVTVPTFGIDMAATITAVILAFGAIVAVAIGGKIGMAVIRKAVGWVSRALG